MTTGSWDNGNNTRLMHSKTWSGGDRPKLKYAKRPWVKVKRDGVTYRYRAGTVGAKPPKRQFDAPHEYHAYGVYGRDQQYYVGWVDQPWIGTSTWTGTSGGGWTQPLHSDGTGYEASLLISSNLELKCLSKLRERLVGSDFNASVFLGESHQTLRLIADSAIRVRKGLSHLRRGDIAGTARSLLEGTSRAPLKPYASMRDLRTRTTKDLSAAWLELQYGWLPLLKDAEGAAHALAQNLEVPLAKKYSAFVTDQKVSNRVGNDTPPHGNPITWKVKTRTELRYTVYMTERPAIAAQLGLLNPEIVAWELVPYSFVVDWFLPIGQYLEARSVQSLINGQYVKSVKTSSFHGDFGGALAAANGQAFINLTVFDRTVGTELDVPLPRFKPISKAASWQHCANAIALLAQQAVGGRAVR